MMKKIDISSKKNCEIYQKIEDYDQIILDVSLLIKINAMCYYDILKYMNYVLENISTIHLQQFYRKRILAEKKARKKWGKNLGLKEVYQCFDAKREVCSFLRKTEEDIISKFIVVDKKIEEICCYCLKNKKKVIINNSLYYLNKNIINNIIKRLGLKEIKIVSNYEEPKVSKHSLFLKNKKNTLFNRRHCIVIKTPQFVSMRKYKKLCYSHVKDQMSKLNFSVTCAFINNSFDYNMNYFEKVGFCRLGILLYAFCRFLINEIQGKIDNVYFLARDGFLIKKVFDIINDRKEIKTNYFCVSRKFLKTIGSDNNLSKTSFNDYLQNIKFKGHVAIVDIGWHGTAQHCLQKNLSDVDIEGYYIGKCQNAYTDIKMYSFLGDVPNVFYFAGAFESLLTAPHGSVVDYNENGCVFGECEYDNSDLIIIQNIHDNVLTFVEKFHSFYNQLNLPLIGQESFLLLKDIFVSPSKLDVKQLGNITFSHKRCSKLLPFSAGKKYWRKSISLRNDYKDCAWKVGYLKKLFKTNIFFKVFVIFNKKRGG